MGDRVLQEPAPAAAHDPIRPLEEPNILDDSPVEQTQSLESSDPASHESPGTSSPREHRDRPIGSAGRADRPTKGEKMPIGMLAARHTPSSKKAIWKSKKFRVWIPIFVAIAAVVAVPILYFPVAHAIARHTLSVSVLHVDSANITNPSDSGFNMTLSGKLAKGGIFPGHAYVHNPVRIYWTRPEDPTKELFLGSAPLAMIGIAHGAAFVNQKSYFTIGDYDAFLDFSTYLIQQEEFTWRLKTEDVQVKALGFITVNGIDLVKDVTIKGVANLTNVHVGDFQIAGNNPDAPGGVAYANAIMTNPSPFGLELGYLTADLYFQGEYLGTATSMYNTNLTAGQNQFSLSADVPFFDNDAQLNALSILASNFVNGNISRVQVRGTGIRRPDGQNINWITHAVKALTLEADLFREDGPYPVLQQLVLEQLDLALEPENAYAPVVNSSHIHGEFGTPFGLSLKAVQAVVNATMILNGTAVAQLNTPLNAPISNILVQNNGGTFGTVDTSVTNCSLQALPGDDAHKAFDQFVTDLVTLNFVPFGFVGSAYILADTPLGRVGLNNVQFAVGSGLVGLSSFSEYPTEVISVDITGGADSTGLEAALTVGMTNPMIISIFTHAPNKLKITSADKDNAFIGYATLEGLFLPTGYSLQHARGTLYPNDNIVARATVAAYLAGRDTHLYISGFPGSSPVDSMEEALESLKVPITLPGLSTELLSQLQVNIQPSTGIDNNNAPATANIANPFSTALHIDSIQANATVMTLLLGTVNTQINQDIKGNATTGINVPVTLDLYPPNIFRVLRELALRANESTDQLDGIMGIAGYKYADPRNFSIVGSYNPLAGVLGDGVEFDLTLPSKRNEAVSTLSKRDRNMYTGFNIVDFTRRALDSLTVDMSTILSVTVDKTATLLPYAQKGVPAVVNNQESLIASLATPIVQKIIDRAVIALSTVTISEPSETSFLAAIEGNITNSGPFDAFLVAPQGVTLSWNGKALGQLALPNITIAADEGSQLNFQSELTIADSDQLSSFTAYLLNEPSFVLQMSSPNVTVGALGIEISGISLLKSVTLRGMDGLKNAIKINNFDLPSNADGGGVRITIDTTIHNPSAVGIKIDALNLEAYFNNQDLGPISANNLTLAPQQDSPVGIAGRLLPQSTDNGIDALSVIFDSFIHGLPSELIVQGTGAQPSASWLVNGVKQLRTGAVLPGALNYQVITDFFINDLKASFDQSHVWDPSASTSNIVAAFQLPFAFPIELVQVSTSLELDENAQSPLSKRSLGKRDSSSNSIATLNIPTVGATTDVVSRQATISFENVPLKATDHQRFQGLLTHLTDDTSVTVQFTGDANAVSHSALGTIPLYSIPVNIPVSILGLQGLTSQQPNVTDIDVAHGYSDYLQINVNTHLANPSHVTLQADDVSLSVFYNDQLIGYAVISSLHLVPGINVIPTQLHYQPSGGAPQAAGREFLEKYIDRTAVDARITGGDHSTKIESLVPALASLKLQVTILPLEQNLITQVSASFPTTVAKDGVARAAVILSNPFDVQIQITSLKAQASSLNYHIGNIDLDKVSPAISSPGHTATLSSKYPLLMETDKNILSNFVKAAAQQNNVDLGILGTLIDMILAVPDDTQITVSAIGNSKAETCAPSGTTRQVQDALKAALANLNVNVAANTTAHLDDFVQDLTITQNDIPLQLDDSVTNLVGLVGRWIVPEIIDGVVLTVSSAYISNIKDSTMSVNVRGSATNASILDAGLSFPEGVGVFYKNTRLATLKLPDLCSTGNKGIPDLNIDSPLSIDNQDAWTNFVVDILHSESFDWTLETPRATVYAAGTIFSDVLFNKTITLAAFNGLRNISITSPDLPGDAPNGIQLVTQGRISSQASVGIDIGRATFDIFFEKQNVGEVTSEGLQLQAKSSTQTTLKGILRHQSSSGGTQALTDLVSPFLQGLNSTVTIQGQSAITDAQPNDPVNWLSKALQSLEVPVVLPGKKAFPIDGITIVELQQTLLKTENAYNIPTESDDVAVVFHNPYAFTLGILQASGDFYVNYNGTDAALLQLPPLTPTQSEKSTGDKANLVIAIRDSDDVTLKSENNDQFSTFYDVVLNTPDVNFLLHGDANVRAETSAGNFWINGLSFNVSSELTGLSGLNTKPVSISNVQVVNGTQQYLGITADALLLNPSNISLTTNNVKLYLYYENQRIGPAYIYYLPLRPGNVSVVTLVEYMPDSQAQAAGQQLLNGYVSNQSQPVEIRGDTDSSPYESLDRALSHLNVRGTLPPLGKWIIPRVDITVPDDVAQTYNVQARIYLNNPFKLDIRITGLPNATALYKEYTLGTITLDTIDPALEAPASKVTELDPIALTLNHDATVLVRFVLQLAQDLHKDLGILQAPLESTLGYPSNYGSEIQSSGTDSQSCNPSESTKTVNGILTDLLQHVPVNVSVYASDLYLQDFYTNLPFNQYNVDAEFKGGVLNLVSVVGKPIVAAIVEGVQISASELYLSNLTDAGASVRLVGSLTNAGPFDAGIDFPNGLGLTVENVAVGTLVNLNSVCSTANKGVPSLELKGFLQVTNQQGADLLLAGILTQSTYNISVQSSNITVRALQQEFANVPITKNISVQGFNDFSDAGIVGTQIQAPDDSDQGVVAEAKITIASQAIVGLDAQSATVDGKFNNKTILSGSLANFVLEPVTTSSFSLSGHLTKTDDESILEQTGNFISQYLRGMNSSLGVSIVEVYSKEQSNSPVQWLSTAMSKVSLPATIVGKVTEIVKSIDILDLEIWVQEPEDDYNAPVEIHGANATFQNPFGFKLGIASTSVSFDLYGGTDAPGAGAPSGGHLTAGTTAVNYSGISTGNEATVTINTPLSRLVIENHDAFNNLFLPIFFDEEAGLYIKGYINATVTSSSGNIPIPFVQIGIPSTLKGLQEFDHLLQEHVYPRCVGSSSGDVYATAPNHGTESLWIEINLWFINYSPVTAHLRDVKLSVSYKDSLVGIAGFNDLSFTRGNTTISGFFEFQPQDKNNLHSFDLITHYVCKSSDIVTTATHANPPLLNDKMLDPVFERLNLPIHLAPMHIPFLQDVRVIADVVHALCTSEAIAQIKLYDPLETPLTVNTVNALASQDDFVYATLPQQPFEPAVRLDPHQSSPWTNNLQVHLTNGLIPAIPLLLKTGEGLNINVTDEVHIDNYHVPQLFTFFPGSPYSIILSLNGLILDISIVAQVLSNPVSAIESLLGEIAAITQCFGADSTVLTNSYSDEPGSFLSAQEQSSTYDPAQTNVLSGIVSQVTGILGGSYPKGTFTSFGLGDLTVNDVTTATGITAGGIASPSLPALGSVQSVLCGYLSFLCPQNAQALRISKTVDPNALSTALYGTNAVPDDKVYGPTTNMALATAAAQDGGKPVAMVLPDLSNAPAWLTATGRGPNIVPISVAPPPTAAPAVSATPPSTGPLPTPSISNPPPAPTQPAQTTSTPSQPSSATSSVNPVSLPNVPSLSAPIKRSASEDSPPLFTSTITAFSPTVQSGSPVLVRATSLATLTPYVVDGTMRTPEVRTSTVTSTLNVSNTMVEHLVAKHYTVSPSGTQSVPSSSPTPTQHRRLSDNEYKNHLAGLKREVSDWPHAHPPKAPEWFDITLDHLEKPAAYAGTDPETLLSILHKYGVRRAQDHEERALYEHHHEQWHARHVKRSSEPPSSEELRRRTPWNFEAPLPEELHEFKLRKV